MQSLTETLLQFVILFASALFSGLVLYAVYQIRGSGFMLCRTMTPWKLKSIWGLTVNLGGDDVVFLMSNETCSQSVPPCRIIDRMLFSWAAQIITEKETAESAWAAQTDKECFFFFEKLSFTIAAMILKGPKINCCSVSSWFHYKSDMFHCIFCCNTFDSVNNKLTNKVIFHKLQN